MIGVGRRFEPALGLARAVARALACGLALGVAALVQLAPVGAAPSLDVDPELRATVPDAPLDLGARKSDIKPNVTQAPVLPSGNPLWAVPLSTLKVTRERPIFSSSRRPPAPPVVAPPVVQATVAPLPPPRQPERPQLALVGTVAGRDGIAVFVDQTNQTIVRLRAGGGACGLGPARHRRPRGDAAKRPRLATAILALPVPEGR